MGTDKALLPFRGSTMIARILAVLSTVVNRTIIVTNNSHAYSPMKVSMAPDVFPGRGPLSGIHAGLRASSSTINLVLSCDIPLVEAGFLQGLVAHARGAPVDIVIPQTSDGRQHPLCAVYSRNCLSIIEKCLADGRLKLDQVYLNPSLLTKVVTSRDFPFADSLLTNVNTRPDYESLR